MSVVAAVFILVASDVLSANTNMQTTTEPPYHIFRAGLASFNDQFYAINASVGSPPQYFTLTLDSRVDGVVVFDASAAYSGKKQKYNRSASSSFGCTSSLSSGAQLGNVQGCDMVCLIIIRFFEACFLGFYS